MSDEDFYTAHKNEYNCYAYAAGDKAHPSTVIGSVPGVAGGAPMARMTASDLRAGMLRDGAIPADVPEGQMPPTRQGYRLIAGVVSPSGYSDFHFYRQETDGFWTHKPARSEVQHTDAVGQLIQDPRTAARDYRNITINGFRWDLNYSQFAGFYYVPEGGMSTGKAPPPKPLNSNESPVNYFQPVDIEWV